MGVFTPQTGDIIDGRGHDVSAKIQEFVNGKGWTHGCVVTYPIGSQRDISLVRSAEANGCVHVWWEKFLNEDTTYDIWVYRIQGITKHEIELGLDTCEKKFLNEKYAYLAWPWFGWASLWNNVLNPLGKKLKLKWLYHDVNSENNWFTKHVFCTKDVYTFLETSTGIYPPMWKELRGTLHQQLPDTFQPMQLRKLIADYPDIFKLEFCREDGEVK
jgi:hypothetical protein